MAEENQRVVDWSDMTEQAVVDRIAEKCVGATVDSISLHESGARQLIRFQLDNGVSVFTEEFFLGED